MDKDTKLLKKCVAAYGRLADFRRRRNLYKDFCYGRQWSQPITLPDGRIVTEEELFRSHGRVPLTNNLIRQLIKSIVGRYRYMTRHDVEKEGSDALLPALGSDAALSARTNTDARSLEEFLISGSAVQRVENGECSNVSPARVFFSPFSEEDASDCRFFGMIHDLPLSDMIRRFSDGTPKRMAQLIAYCMAPTDDCAIGPEDDDMRDLGDQVRLIEVWQRRVHPKLLVHDLRDATYACVPFTDDVYREFKAVGKRRGEKEGVEFSADVEDCWEQVWLTLSGDVVSREIFPEHHPLPIVMRFYPMIDGEVHSLVEDVISQQRYVNRLVMLMDEILDMSAKGVLLFPIDQLPPGMSWRQLRDLWSRPGAVVPFRRTSKAVKPMQVSMSGNCAGASEMLQTQLQMFDDISGITRGVRSGMSDATSAAMLRRETENSAISMLDILSAFHGFTLQRDYVLGESLSEREVIDVKPEEPTEP